MMKDFDQLFNGWISGDLSDDEIKQFLDQVEQDNPGMPGAIDQMILQLKTPGLGTKEQRDRLYDQLSGRRFQQPAKVRKLFSTPLKWAVAILIIITGAALWWNAARTGKPEQPIVTNTDQTPLLPGGDKAILVLSDGSQITLDSAANGQLARQQGALVLKSGDGQIAYEQLNANTPKKAIAFNTLSTPKGGQYKLSLPDGTKVWLNAASSITYPTSFTGNERQVSVTGEAYFEVAKIPGANGSNKMPFKVQIKSGVHRNMEVMVLGTHFNINAYDDEPVIKTTLLEGSIKLKKDKDQYLLQPGQQAQVKAGGTLDIKTGIDTDEVLAWKNGYFYFEHTDLQTVMRQIARWYDVTIEYRGDIPDMKFAGDIPRSANAGQVLKILEASNIHFEVEGKKIIVIP